MTEDKPIGTVRKVQSIFWIGDWVAHRCEAPEDGHAPTRGLVTRVVFTPDGVEYFVQWTPAASDTHSEIELEPAGEP